MQAHDRSTAGTPAVALEWPPGRPALAGAGSGLSLSDGNASASVLSSLGEASDFDADIEADASAAELDLPTGAAQKLLQSPVAQLPGAGSMGSPESSCSAGAQILSSPSQQEHAGSSHHTLPDAKHAHPATNTVPGSPFQQEQVQSSQASVLDTPAQTHVGYATGSGMEACIPPGTEEPGQFTEPGHNRLLLEQKQQATHMQAASSDLMEAWNEQEQSSGKEAPDQPDLAHVDLKELEQATAMLDSIADAPELAPQQHSSLSSASELLVDGQGPELQDRAPAGLPLQSLGSRSSMERSAAEPEHAGDTAPLPAPQHLQDHSHPEPYRAAVASSDSPVAAAAASVRPADDAFRERARSSHAAVQQGEDHTRVEQASSDILSATSSMEHSSAHHESFGRESTQRAGLSSSSEASEQAFSSLSLPAAQQGHALEAESPDMAASQRRASEQGVQLPGIGKAAHGVDVTASEQSASTDVLPDEAMPGSGLSNGQAADLEGGGDKLAYAEALEMALATGEAPHIRSGMDFPKMTRCNKQLPRSSADLAWRRP